MAGAAARTLEKPPPRALVGLLPAAGGGALDDRGEVHKTS